MCVLSSEEFGDVESSSGDTLQLSLDLSGAGPRKRQKKLPPWAPCCRRCSWGWEHLLPLYHPAVTCCAALPQAKQDICLRWHSSGGRHCPPAERTLRAEESIRGGVGTDRTWMTPARGVTPGEAADRSFGDREAKRKQEAVVAKTSDPESSSLGRAGQSLGCDRLVSRTTHSW